MQAGLQQASRRTSHTPHFPAAARYTDALGEEVAGCEGTAFYRLHRCGRANAGSASCVHPPSTLPPACLLDVQLLHPTPSLVPGVATPCPPPSHPAVIRVLRDIAPGEEITMSYIGEGMRARESAGTLTLHAACLPYCLPP